MDCATALLRTVLKQEDYCVGGGGLEERKVSTTKSQLIEVDLDAHNLITIIWLDRSSPH